MTDYERRKESARQEAIEWQHTTAQEPMSYGELADWQGYFQKLARRYGLTEEFRENWII